MVFILREDVEVVKSLVVRVPLFQGLFLDVLITLLYLREKLFLFYFNLVSYHDFRSCTIMGCYLTFVFDVRLFKSRSCFASIR